MAAGQAVFSGSWDVPAVLAIEERLERRAADAGVAHAAMLRDVLALHVEHLRAGMGLMTDSVVARVLRVSEWKAGRLLHDALGLAELPQAFEALEWGLLQPDQCHTVVTQLASLSPPQRLLLWRRLLDRLGEDCRVGAVLPPTRLGELLKGWVLELVPVEAEQARQRAEEDRTLVYKKRDDGLADIFLIGVRAPDAQAILHRIRAGSQPVSVWDDERTADQRRLDAAVDLLLGRDVLGDGGLGGHDSGCLPGQGAPCGADLRVAVPVGAADGSTDEVAVLAGHGPIERDLLQALLLNAPRLRPVFVDDNGVPVGIGTARQTLTPERGSLESVQQALAALRRMTPARLFPRDPHDHPPPDPGPSGRDGPTPHPPDTPGPYVVIGALRELIFSRAPRCEFLGCGLPASACDAEHDLAHPDGPTCACNLGPLCRHHHRLKQLGWTKTRHRDGSLTWTDPIGRSWLSHAQHTPPQPAVRPVPPAPLPSEWDELDPYELTELLWELDGRPDDPPAWELRAQDLDPHDVPPPDFDERDTRWSFDLDDPYAWEPEPALPDAVV